MDKEKLIGIIEALVFSSEKPLREEDMRRAIPGIAGRDIKEAISDLVKIYDEGSGGIYLSEIAGGYQFRTRSEFSPFVRNLLEIKPRRLSRAALETLAIIAYRQPILRTEIEHIRGVDSGGVLKVLLEKRLIKIMGRKDVAGRPLLYGTTQEFLEVFGLKDLKSLPTLREMEELYLESQAEQQAELLFTDDKD